MMDSFAPYPVSIDWIRNHKSEDKGFEQIIDRVDQYTEAELTPVVIYYPINSSFIVTSQEAIQKKYH